MNHVSFGRLCGQNALFFYVKGGGKYDYALNSMGYDKFSKNMLSFKSENDDALWCLLKDLCVIIREHIFNFWHVRNGKYQKCVSFAMSVCLSIILLFICNKSRNAQWISIKFHIVEFY
jgi:hypothetical protein